MVLRVHRDISALPQSQRESVRNLARTVLKVLIEPFAVTGSDRRRVRAAPAHATSFWTWHDLCVRNRLSRSLAVEWMAGLVRAAQPPGATP
jgi:hypothetical protein